MKSFVDCSLPSPKAPPDFELNPFFGNGSDFQRKIWRLISLIGPGETTTYGELAEAAGSPGGARAAGNACNRNPLALINPCHRGVAVNGLRGFAEDLRIKRMLLELGKAPLKRQARRARKVKCLVEKFQHARHRQPEPRCIQEDQSFTVFRSRPSRLNFRSVFNSCNIRGSKSLICFSIISRF